jgi:hypothetical protein
MAALRLEPQPHNVELPIAAIGQQRKLITMSLPKVKMVSDLVTVALYVH